MRLAFSLFGIEVSACVHAGPPPAPQPSLFQELLANPALMSSAGMLLGKFLQSKETEETHVPREAFDDVRDECRRLRVELNAALGALEEVDAGLKRESEPTAPTAIPPELRRKAT